MTKICLYFQNYFDTIKTVLQYCKKKNDIV